MIIPRERKIVRVYVQVSSALAQKYRTCGRDPEIIMEAVRQIMHPFNFKASRLEWSTIYTVSNFGRVMLWVELGSPLTAIL